MKLLNVFYKTFRTSQRRSKRPRSYRELGYNDPNRNERLQTAAICEVSLLAFRFSSGVHKSAWLKLQRSKEALDTLNTALER